MEDSSDQIITNLVGPGFANLGNTCFLNAVLQCVTRTVPLVQGLQSVGHVKPCESYNNGFCLMCTLLYHIEDAVAADGRVVSPRKLVKNLRYISSDFENFQQEDAHEFLQCLLGRLETCVSSLDKRNIVRQVFGGSLVSRIRCCECGQCSDTYEPMIDLSIEIGNTDSLQDALKSFTYVEPIKAEDTKFTCENCNEVVSIKKQLKLESAPSIASFHLKRFKNDGSCVDKIDKHVECPLELDLSPYSRNRDMELKYYLYAIVVHDGISFSSGHYYSFVRFSQDEWYKMDDSRVSRVSEEVVLAEEAYILFYAKMGTPWFSSFMMSEKQSIVTDISNTSRKSVLESVEFSTPVRYSSPDIYAEAKPPCKFTFLNRLLISGLLICGAKLRACLEIAARKIKSSKRKLEQNQEDGSSKRRRRLVERMPSQREERNYWRS